MMKMKRKSDPGTNKQIPKEKKKSVNFYSTEVPNIEEVQRALRLCVTQFQPPPVINGYEKEKVQLHDLIKRTATAGESNSLLLCGPRGCGKTMLVAEVLKDLCAQKEVTENLLIVRLNALSTPPLLYYNMESSLRKPDGSYWSEFRDKAHNAKIGLLQTNDRIALKEMTRQLKLENTVGDKVFGSFAETLQFLLQALKSGDQNSKSVLFVLEEFDLFAQHKNQTLLYNLFDVSQSAQTPICVLGVTCRLDVVELLEKRVKSRFSHRQLHLFNKLTFGRYRQICTDLLCLGKDFQDQSFAKKWNEKTKVLMEETAVKDILERQFSLSNDVRGLKNLLIYPICQISEQHDFISASDIISSFKSVSSDSKSSMLHGISILELCLIIAMKHLTDIYDGEPFNFEMVYSMYLKFARRCLGMQVYEKPVVMKAFEHLQALEFFRCQTAGGTQTQKEYRLMTLLIHPAQILDALQKYPCCPTEVKQWASQSIS